MNLAITPLQVMQNLGFVDDTRVSVHSEVILSGVFFLVSDLLDKIKSFTKLRLSEIWRSGVNYGW